MTWTDVLILALDFGGLISAWMVTVIILSLLWNPEIWVDDYPPEIRAVFPPKSERARRQTVWVAVPTYVVLIGLLVWMVTRLYAMAGGFPGFLQIALAVWVALQTFNVIDLLLVDWLLVETLRPRFVYMPGAERFADRRFYRHHFRGFLKGFVGITLVSLAIAASLWGAHLIL